MVTLRDCVTGAGKPAGSAQVPSSVVDKAFTLLEAWGHRGESLGVSELARRTGLPKSTSHRLLGILETSGVIERLATSYRLGDRFRGFSGLLSSDYPPDLRDVSLPFLQDLYELTHETIHLAVFAGDDVHCVEKIYGHRHNPIRSRVGGTLPAHSTAVGKVLLAYSPPAAQYRAVTAVLPAFTPATLTQPLRLTAELRSILRHGLAFDRCETHPDVTCVAAPVLSPGGEAIAAISISGPAYRFNPTTVAERLRRAARAASVTLAAAETDRCSA